MTENLDMIIGDHYKGEADADLLSLCCLFV